MANNFNGKKILITGAGGSIGRTIARSLVEQGAIVYALDNVKEKLDNLVETIPEIIPVNQDLEQWDGTHKTVDELGYMNGLVNCAGICHPVQNAMDVSKDNLRKCQAVDVDAPINLMQIIGAKMISGGNGGSMVNISSIGGESCFPGVLGYCVSKAALSMATKMFALELGPHNIRVNSVSPGAVKTDMLQHLGFTDEDYGQVESKTPLGRLTQEQDVADLVLFLLSDKSSMISGANYKIDGGLTCQLP